MEAELLRSKGRYAGRERDEHRRDTEEEAERAPQRPRAPLPAHTASVCPRREEGERRRRDFDVVTRRPDAIAFVPATSIQLALRRRQVVDEVDGDAG